MPFTAHAALLTACFFWAISFIATKTALPVIPPLTVVLLRLIISSLCFLGWIALRKKRLTVNSRGWWQLLFLSLFNVSLHYGLQTIGLQYTSAANASLYAITGPLAILVISALILRERPTPQKLAGMAIAIAGVLVVMGRGTLEQIEWTKNLFGDLLVIASIFMWGIFTVMSKRLSSKLTALEITAVTTWLGTLQLIPFSVIEMQRSGFSFAQVTPMAWAAVAFLGVTCSFLATLLYVRALAHAESQKVGVYLYTIPPMTYLFSALFLHETITFGLLLGSCLVFAGVLLTERAKSR